MCKIFLNNEIDQNTNFAKLLDVKYFTHILGPSPSNALIIMSKDKAFKMVNVRFKKCYWMSSY